jgi:ABC-type transport system involved in multi-copper enzyme maturation permease subunit
MTGRIYAIAINTFREAVRDRVLYGVLAFASAVLLFTLALAQLSLDQQRRVVLDVGLASISIFSVVVAVFLGSSLLYKEIERKTLYVILPKPIRRHEFLLGKYFGIILTGAVFVALMGAIQLWVTSLQAGAELWMAGLLPVVLGAILGAALWKARDRTAILVPWAAVAFGAAAWLCAGSGVALEPIAAALVLTVGEVFFLAAIALLFSSFSTPFLTGALTFGVWIVGRSADDMVTMKSEVVAPAIKSLLRGIAEVAPNLNLFVPGRHTLVTKAAEHGGAWDYVAEAMGYAALYAALVLAAGALIFRRRDFL